MGVPTGGGRNLPTRVDLSQLTLITSSHRSPDDAKIKDKMVFASSSETLKQKLDGIAFEVQGTDPSEISHDTGSSLSTSLGIATVYILIPCLLADLQCLPKR